MTVNVVVLGMTDYPSDRHSLTLPLLVKQKHHDIVFTSFDKQVVEMYSSILECDEDTCDKVDELLHLYLNAVDMADVLFIINPMCASLVSSEQKKKLAVGFNTWISYLAGYAYSQGVPTVYYAGQEDVQLHPIIHRQVHSVIHTLDELMFYDFGALAPVNKARLILPV